MIGEFPTADMALTHIFVVNDMKRSHAFYVDVLGASLVREYGGTSEVLNFQGSWILLVTAGGPTRDKPDVSFVPRVDRHEVAHAMTIRVPDCRAAYETLVARGAEFLTPPVDWGKEVRCFFRDPDGRLLEISQAD